MNRNCEKHGSVKHYKRKEGGYRCNKCSIESVAKRRRKMKQILVKERGGKCERCTYDKCIQALHFHHRDPDKKSFGIAAKGHTRSLEKAQEEINKCILICANCHRKEHFDYEKFENNKKEILELSKEYKERHAPYDRKIILDLKEAGLSNEEIMAELNCSRCTVWRALSNKGQRKKKIDNI